MLSELGMAHAGHLEEEATVKATFGICTVVSCVLERSLNARKHEANTTPVHSRWCCGTATTDGQETTTHLLFGREGMAAPARRQTDATANCAVMSPGTAFGWAPNSSARSRLGDTDPVEDVSEGFRGRHVHGTVAALDEADDVRSRRACLCASAALFVQVSPQTSAQASSSKCVLHLGGRGHTGDSKGLALHRPLSCTMAVPATPELGVAWQSNGLQPEAGANGSNKFSWSRAAAASTSPSKLRPEALHHGNRIVQAEGQTANPAPRRNEQGSCTAASRSPT